MEEYKKTSPSFVTYNMLKMNTCIFKYLFLMVCLCGFSWSYAQTLTQELQAEEAKEKLTDAGIPEDEVKARLKEKGIDLDNLRPEQLPNLEEDIKIVVAEIEAEKADTSKVDDIAGKIELGVDSLMVKKAEETVGDNINEVASDMQEGASLEEALANDLTRKLSEKYRAKTNIFGHHLFYNKSIDLYKTTSSSTTPNSYVLDVGDKIAINIFGSSQADLLYEIEEDGFIRPSGMYKIYLKGVTIGKAKVLLKNRFRQAYVFDDGQFDVNLHTARTININLFGEVNQPGSYTISALNTALNAIIAGGGVTTEASVREIKIISDGEEKVLDIYAFINNPQTVYDFYLKDNDIIFIPKLKHVVSANGNGFRINGRFELKQGENFEDLLGFTQGLSSNAYTQSIRYVTKKGEERVLKNYTLKELNSANLTLNNGDVFTINNSLIAYENYIRVNGAVRHPGEYEFKSGLKISDLLELAHLEEETFSKLAYLRRKNTDGTYQLIRIYVEDILANSTSFANIDLKKEDVLTLYNKAAFVDNYEFQITGAVRAPRFYFYDPSDNITIYDAIMMSKGLKTNATEFGYIIGRRLGNSNERNYTVINLTEITSNPASVHNLKIKPNDRIVIPSAESYSDEFKVSIGGAVRNPGAYVYDSTLSIKDMLVMAGGLKLEAASNKVDVFRLSIDEDNPTRTYATSIILDHNLDPFNDNDTLVLQPFDRIVVRNTPEFEPMQLVQLNGEVRYPGEYAILGENETVSSLIERAGGLTNEALPEAAVFIRNQDGIGRIVTRIDKAVKCKNHHDIKIKDQDEITIPKIVDIVTLDKKGTRIEEEILVNEFKGANLKIAVSYKSKRAGWYVRKYAGGFDRGAAKRKTIVIHPNGEVKKTVNLLLFKIYPKVRRDSEVRLTLKKKEIKKRAKKVEEERVRKMKEENGIIDPPKPEKEKVSVTERLMQIQALVTIATSTVTTTVTSLLLIRNLNEN